MSHLIPAPQSSGGEFLLYLSEDEFTHILSTFPLVDESVKSETRNTYRELLRSGKLPS
jgi:hypothetical protein